jgi:hypothetical protein
MVRRTEMSTEAQAPARRARGYLSRDTDAGERAKRAARCYVNQLPLPLPGGQQVIEAPTLQQLADAYGVTLARVHAAFVILAREDHPKTAREAARVYQEIMHEREPCRADQ